MSHKVIHRIWYSSYFVPTLYIVLTAKRGYNPAHNNNN